MTISAQNLAQRYIDALTEIGVAAKRDDDNDVVFKILGTGSFYLSLDAEKDPEFMRLVFPNFYARHNPAIDGWSRVILNVEKRNERSE